MKTIFIIILFLHGFIHLLGFVKAFEMAEVKELTLQIPKAYGILWLTGFVLFAITAVTYLIKADYWWIFGLIGTLISQWLIFYFWKDALYGTIPNLIIAVVCIIAWGNYSFSRNVEEEKKDILNEVPLEDLKIIRVEMLDGLPVPVQKWLKNSLITGKEEISTVRLQQQYKLKLKPDQKDWYQATAEQYSTIDPPSFIWILNMQMFPLIDVNGRDKFQHGKGEMLIKILSLIPIVNKKNNEKINKGTLQRYLGEMVWYPSAALSPYIKWKEINEFSAEATMTYGSTEGSGIFHFDEKGNPQKFTALRYYNSSENTELKEWKVEIKEQRLFDGFMIPSKGTVSWKLETSDWTWAQFEITEVQYNNR